tara:strand:+ start:127980 stop:128882 length:903 start_codon:yes stop_codon:yes gene_type:complete
MTNKLLFHYCGSPTGFAILQSRTFRLSPLSAANDSLEGRVLGQVFGHLLETSGLPPEVRDFAKVVVEGYADSTEGFAFCLSEKADLLSQWRAYGDDGSGIAIGFSPEVLIQDYGMVNFGAKFYELSQVKYGEKCLIETLRPFSEQIGAEFGQFGTFVRLGCGVTKEQAKQKMADAATISKGIFMTDDKHSRDIVKRFIDALSPLHFQIYHTKPDSFYEECEWRILRFRHRVALPEIEYCASNDSIKPYIPCLIADQAKDAVQEVILGPKNRTNINWMRAFLTSIGLQHVAVRRSDIASYR